MRRVRARRTSKCCDEGQATTQQQLLLCETGHAHAFIVNVSRGKPYSSQKGDVVLRALVVFFRFGKKKKKNYDTIFRFGKKKKLRHRDGTTAHDRVRFFHDYTVSTAP